MSVSIGSQSLPESWTVNVLDTGMSDNVETDARSFLALLGSDDNFSCPYYRHDLKAFSECAGAHFENRARLNEHLREKHIQSHFYCEKCGHGSGSKRYKKRHSRKACNKIISEAKRNGTFDLIQDRIEKMRDFTKISWEMVDNGHYARSNLMNDLGMLLFRLMGRCTLFHDCCPKMRNSRTTLCSSAALVPPVPVDPTSNADDDQLLPHSEDRENYIYPLDAHEMPSYAPSPDLDDTDIMPKNLLIDAANTMDDGDSYDAPAILQQYHEEHQKDVLAEGVADIQMDHDLMTWLIDFPSNFLSSRISEIANGQSLGDFRQQREVRYGPLYSSCLGNSLEENCDMDLYPVSKDGYINTTYNFWNADSFSPPPRPSYTVRIPEILRRDSSPFPVWDVPGTASLGQTLYSRQQLYAEKPLVSSCHLEINPTGHTLRSQTSTALPSLSFGDSHGGSSFDSMEVGTPSDHLSQNSISSKNSWVDPRIQISHMNPHLEAVEPGYLDETETLSSKMDTEDVSQMIRCGDVGYGMPRRSKNELSAIIHNTDVVMGGI